MKAIVTTGPRAADDPRAFEERELPMPVPAAGDLRVRIEAVSVNPVDTKLRRSPLPACQSSSGRAHHFTKIGSAIRLCINVDTLHGS